MASLNKDQETDAKQTNKQEKRMEHSSSTLVYAAIHSFNNSPDRHLREHLKQHESHFLLLLKTFKTWKSSKE